MSTNVTQSATNLSALAVEINEAHAEAEKAAQSALEHALRAGRLLTEAKTLCQHGSWLTWLKDNFSGSARTAQAYMSLATGFESLPGPEAQRVAHLPLREAMRLLAEQSPEGDRHSRMAPAQQPRRSIVPLPRLAKGRRYVMLGTERDDPKNRAILMTRPHPTSGYWYVEVQWVTRDRLNYSERAVKVTAAEEWDAYTADVQPTSEWHDQADDLDEPWHDWKKGPWHGHQPVSLLPEELTVPPQSTVPRPPLEPNTSYSLDGANDDLLEVWPCDRDATKFWKVAHISAIHSARPLILFDTRGGNMGDIHWNHKTQHFTPAEGAQWVSAPVTLPSPWWELDDEVLKTHLPTSAQVSTDRVAPHTGA
jgi:hypothetical protein